MLTLHVFLRSSDVYLEYRMTEAEAEDFFADLEGRSGVAADAPPDRFLRFPFPQSGMEERLRASEIVRVLVVREKG